ncbi:MAG: 16S rRNA (uracil(1498)-N(3))-methyltransferase [Ruminococcaceae bacterium]|nr:16S rRNA (uracil(1498)-N(3))-methyltransferase [Oscillospiraceae bacterium]
MSSKIRVFVPTENISDNEAVIVGGDAFHISGVMRLNVGDVITVCDMKRNVYDGSIVAVSKEEVRCKLVKTDKTDTELPCRVTVYQGVPKGDKLETVVQKSVELGAFRIVPVLCDRCVSRPDKKAALSKNARYNKISESAACQCGRMIIPEVSLMITFDEMLKEMAESDGKSFACFEGEEKVRIKDILPKTPCDVSFFIGPEGGISEKEIEKIKNAKIPAVTLGKRILRTETAPLYALSAISVLWE